jgi:MFS family permease
LEQLIEFSEKDKENPKRWSRFRKFTNVAIISLMAIMSPLASSMFTPGIGQIAEDLQTLPETVIGATTGFVVFLGIGPLILAPLSETFGRRRLYIVCFSTFALLQIPTALSPNIATMITIRTLSGFFGSKLL